MTRKIVIRTVGQSRDLDPTKPLGALLKNKIIQKWR
ncbi:unnamed protein product, partial [marine sediment metagenome]